ncbi:MAG TPA: Uma2 family endonuclease [Chloroflexota bacterium]|nr:Uma2 family endonuclease [Chloroflexota bacterium]
MIALEDQTRRYTVEEWRDVLEHSDVKYEYHHGWLVAMAGGTADHSRIALNVCGMLDAALDGTPCRVYNSDLAVRLSPSEYRFSDAVVTCDERDRGRVKEVQAPRLIVEVLSDSTEREDRTEKFALCRDCPSVEEYVLIATRYRAVEVYRRAPGDWTTHVYQPGELMELRSIDVQLAVSDLYRLTDVPAPRRPGPAAPPPEGQG